ncbi:hypothetical protein OG21DRAFT_1499772 [Imleria badia]|nr:hypothetical protein OG21DRAFT_1499772 [Imleria badia]
MLCARFLSIVVLSLAGIPVCLADISLWLPGFDQSPLSVTVIGVGAGGETTYQMVPGQPTGDEDPQVFGTAIVVEGPGNMLLDDGDMFESCALTNGMADCMVVIDDATFYTDYALLTPIVVQGGSTASPGPTSAVSGGVQTTPTPGSSAQGPAATQTAALPSESASSGVRVTPAVGTMAGMVVIWAVLA